MEQNSFRVKLDLARSASLISVRLFLRQRIKSSFVLGTDVGRASTIFSLPALTLVLRFPKNYIDFIQISAKGGRVEGKLVYSWRETMDLKDAIDRLIHITCMNAFEPNNKPSRPFSFTKREVANKTLIIHTVHVLTWMRSYFVNTRFNTVDRNVSFCTKMQGNVLFSSCKWCNIKSRSCPSLRSWRIDEFGFPNAIRAQVSRALCWTGCSIRYKKSGMIGTRQQDSDTLSEK